MLFDVLFLGTWEDKDGILIGPSSPDGLKNAAACHVYFHRAGMSLSNLLHVVDNRILQGVAASPISALCPSRMGTGCHPSINVSSGTCLPCTLLSVHCGKRGIAQEKGPCE